MIVSLLRIRLGEGRLAFRVLAMMFVVWSGFAVGGNAVEGLLFARFGPNALPHLFVALGLTTAAVMLGMNAVLARPRPMRLLLWVPAHRRPAVQPNRHPAGHREPEQP